MANTLLLHEEAFVFATFSPTHFDCTTTSELTCFQSMKSIVLQQNTCCNLSPVPASMTVALTM